MKRILSVVLAVAVLISLAGCSSVEHMDNENTSTFITVEHGTNYYIVYHKETKVMYVVSDGSHSHGIFTLLVDTDGTPMLYESED